MIKSKTWSNTGQLRKTSAKNKKSLKISNCNRRQLYRYLCFYKIYPSIVETVPAQFKKKISVDSILKKKVGTSAPQLSMLPKKFINCLSYSHLKLLVDIDDVRRTLKKSLEEDGQS